ncbi:MAG TPA: OsmC family protein [Saprospiraceae bacterium]|nr:OsmC family protein [Saprospiraceae bacterium]
MNTAKVLYLGDLRTQATHLRSGEWITTDAPIDNQGKGEYFSPTDLVASALGSCMLTVMGIAARTHGIDMDGTYADILKVMADQPRRISEIHVGIFFPDKAYTSKQKSILEHAARTCPVGRSLSEQLKEILTFHWPENESL